ncbi:MAG: tripartite tricarboxylate transporter TctB family protein [Hydrogenophaga sp.]|jgi:hypothetical protein
MLVKSKRDFYSGLLFVVVGAAFALGAQEYELGKAARMGPGYFPTMQGILLVLLGLGVLVNSLRHGGVDGDPIGAIAWRPLCFIIGANVVFGALLVGVPALGIPAFGLIFSIYALVLIASMARPKSSPVESFVLATLLALLSYGAFVKLLNLQFPVWPQFLSM